MSESIQMRTTQESSGDYRVYATATVGGSQPVKGLAIHTDLTERVDPNEYVEVEISEGQEGVDLSPDKATSATVRLRSEGGPSVRHVYASPAFLSEFGDFEFDGEDTDLDAVPDVSITSIASSTEDDYETDKEERGSTDEAAEALFGDEEESDESQEGEAEADDSESEDEEDESPVSDEELDIAA